MTWRWRFRPVQSRTAAIRALMQQVKAEMPADGITPPRVRWELPEDRRVRIPNKRPMTRWELHQARVMDRLRKGA